MLFLLIGLKEVPPTHLEENFVLLDPIFGSRARKKPLGYLLTFQQHDGKTLKEFMIRFNLEKLIVEEPTDDNLVFSTIYRGISLEELIMLKLAQRQPNNLQCLMDKVKEFINEKEMFKAMKASRRSHRKPEARKRKEHRQIEDELRSLRKRFNDYDFTLLNAGISKVQMEIKKDSEY